MFTGKVPLNNNTLNIDVDDCNVECPFPMVGVPVCRLSPIDAHTVALNSVMEIN